jgi:GNAT superfamily N-acetyltransferase
LPDVERLPVEGRAPSPGSTFRSTARFVCREDGAVVATAELGQAEVFERHPPEPFIAGITWTDGHLDAAHAVVTAAADAAATPVHVHTNASRPEPVGPRLALLEDCGFELFQEKEGLWWADDGGELPEAGSLVVRSLAEVGREPLVRLIAAAMVGTLDRTDRLMIARLGRAAWAAAFVDERATEADETSWLVASRPDGDEVGFVALVERDAGEGIATIALIGVLPTERGRRYSDQLLHAAHQAARRRGFTAVLSHADVTNLPMLNAFARVGATADGHPWHKWHHVRTPVSR